MGAPTAKLETVVVVSPLKVRAFFFLKLIKLVLLINLTYRQLKLNFKTSIIPNFKNDAIIRFIIISLGFKHS